MICQLFCIVKIQIMLKYWDFSPLKLFSIIFFCIFVGNFKRVKRLRTQGNALKRDFRMENRRFESNE